mgnify:FL=1
MILCVNRRVLHTVTIDTPAGEFTMLGDDSRLYGAGFTGDLARVMASIRALPDDVGWEIRPGTNHLLEQAVDAVKQYFEGNFEPVATFPIWQQGTPFRHQVWSTLRRTKAGQRLSYSQLADASGFPGATRAAATTCAVNSVGLFIPCHRVIRADGSIGKFGWNQQVKVDLLEHEARLAGRS